MIRILIIEDDTDINNMTAEFLREKGCIAEQAFSGTEGRLLWQMKEFDLLLLDLMLPGLPGGELLRQIRAASRIPVIVLTAKNSLDDKVELLGGGADDYLTKPFSVLQLRARVEAHLRRERRVPSYRFVSGRLRFDLQAKKVYAREQELSLTRSEYMLCETLARHPGLVYTREQLLEEVFGFDSDSGEAAVTEHIKNLRGKLASCGSAPIETVWGMGYRWNSEKA